MGVGLVGSEMAHTALEADQSGARESRSDPLLYTPDNTRSFRTFPTKKKKKERASPSSPVATELEPEHIPSFGDRLEPSFRTNERRKSEVAGGWREKRDRRRV